MVREQIIEILDNTLGIHTFHDVEKGVINIMITGKVAAADRINELKKSEIIYPSMDEINEWSFLVPEHGTKWQCYVSGIKDLMNYMKANNE